MSDRFYYNAPCGFLNIEEDDDGTLCSCRWADSPDGRPLGGIVKDRLDSYFTTGILPNDIPLKDTGTDFQKKVWRVLQSVEDGSTVSYSQLANMCGFPRAIRAVANALHSNPIHVLIPCHRVIGANGKLTGYAGGLDRKAFLLDLEGGVINLPPQNRS